MPRRSLPISPIGYNLLFSGGLSAAQQVDDYISNNLALLLYYKFNEASGDLISYGSVSANGSVSGMTQGSAPILAPDTSYAADGADDVVTITAASIPTVRALTTQRWLAIVDPNSLGEGNGGILMSYNVNRTNFQFASSNRLRFDVYTNGTVASAISNINQISDCIGNPCILFADHDDANALGNGRVPRLFKGVNNTVTQLTLATQTAATGTTAMDAIDLHIGNRGALDFTFDGRFGRTGIGAGLWTTEIMQSILSRSGF